MISCLHLFTAEYLARIIAENNFFFYWQIFVSIIGTFVSIIGTFVEHK